MAGNTPSTTCGFRKERRRVWHPESPGVSLIVPRRWFKNRPFATHREVLKMREWSQISFSVDADNRSRSDGR
jgi:hypothetical protein